MYCIDEFILNEYIYGLLSVKIIIHCLNFFSYVYIPFDYNFSKIKIFLSVNSIKFKFYDAS